LVDLFLEAHDQAPNEIVFLDATDDPVHWKQEGRFFHCDYDCYCYLPLYVFCGRRLLAAKLRECQLALYADLTSAATMRANQLRL
jgi:hypothetical protein